MSKKQPCINSIFKVKKNDPIEEAFLRQCEELQNDDDKCVPLEDKIDNQKIWAKEKSCLEDEIKVLKHDNGNLKRKYENLKVKHMELLKVLLKLEKKNQNQEIDLQVLQNKYGLEKNSMPFAAKSVPDPSTYFEIDMLVINILFYYCRNQ